MDQLFSPGEIIDRYTILLVKHTKGLAVAKQLVLFEHYLKKKEYLSKYARDIIELTESNKKQWGLEDQIRNPELTLTAIGACAVSIRKQNEYRVSVINKINESEGFDFMELKQYGS